MQSTEAGCDEAYCVCVGRGDSSETVGAGAVLLGRARIRRAAAPDGEPSAAGHAGEFGEAQLLELFQSFSPSDATHPFSQLEAPAGYWHWHKRRAVVLHELANLAAPRSSGAKSCSAQITAEYALWTDEVRYRGWLRFQYIDKLDQLEHAIVGTNIADICDELNRRCDAGPRLDPDQIFASFAAKLPSLTATC